MIDPSVAVLALALGLVFGLVCYLVTNLSPGGMITPGWLALALIQKPELALLIGGVVVVTYGAIRVLRRIVILYGKRLFASVVLTGVFFQMTFFVFAAPGVALDAQTETLGLIVPGLIAYQLLRQPVAATLTATASVTSLAYVIVLTGVKLRLIQTGGRGVSADSLNAPTVEPDLLGLLATGAATAGGFAVLALLLWRVRRQALVVADTVSPAGAPHAAWRVDPRVGVGDGQHGRDRAESDGRAGAPDVRQSAGSAIAGGRGADRRAAGARVGAGPASAGPADGGEADGDPRLRG